MKRLFKTRVNLASDSVSVWNALTQNSFVNDFLPEITRDISKLTLKRLAMHKHGLTVMPSYAIPNKTLHWRRGAGLNISMARQDLNVIIDDIEINLSEADGHTTVELSVNYNAKLGARFLLAENAIQHLFSHKLTILKQDLDQPHFSDKAMQNAYS